MRSLDMEINERIDLGLDSLSCDIQDYESDYAEMPDWQKASFYYEWLRDLSIYTNELKPAYERGQMFPGQSAEFERIRAWLRENRTQLLRDELLVLEGDEL